MEYAPGSRGMDPRPGMERKDLQGHLGLLACWEHGLAPAGAGGHHRSPRAMCKGTWYDDCRPTGTCHLGFPSKLQHWHAWEPPVGTYQVFSERKHALCIHLDSILQRYLYRYWDATSVPDFPVDSWVCNINVLQPERRTLSFREAPLPAQSLKMQSMKCSCDSPHWHCSSASKLLSSVCHPNTDSSRARNSAVLMAGSCLLTFLYK